MKKVLGSFILFVALNGAMALPAFPGAEGWGSETPGGRSGAVLLVTNTNADGAGSFRQALLTAGKRIIVFRTSGVVTLTGDILLEAANLSYVTIAGQTSPGTITITSPTGSNIWQYTGCQFHDAIWRFLRFRVVRETGGNGGDHTFEHYRAYNYIIDHCDFSGGDDECYDNCYVRDMTVQWSTVANSGPGGQVYGALIAYSSVANPLKHISWHHNLMAHLVKRGPEFNWCYVTDASTLDSVRVDVRNNVNYNFDQIFMALWATTSSGYYIQANLVGNYFKAGPDISYNYIPPVSIDTGVYVYAKNNYWDSPGRLGCYWQTDPDTVVDIRYGHVPTFRQNAWTMPPVTTLTWQKARDTVLARAGAFPRDSMNTRTVREVKNRAGTYGKCDDPLFTSGPAAPADADNDGMPDFWETGMGLNPNGASDNITDKDDDGYTNVEEYINDLALARLCQDYYNNVYPIPSTWPDYNPGCCKSLAVELNGKAGLKRALSVSPNPCAAGKGLVIRSGAGDIQILDIRGRVLKNMKSSSLINFNGTLSPGLYFVRQGGVKCKFIILP